MFKCKDSSICLHIADICNGYSDCHVEDDEALCSVKNWIVGCKFMGFIVKCKTTNITIKSIELLQHFIFADISEIKKSLACVDTSP